MNLGLAPFFRSFELPWSRDEENERKFKKLLRVLIILATIVAIILWLLPQPERPKYTAEDLPKREVQLIVEKPPPPPPPEPEKQPEPEKPKPQEQKPVEKPKPNVRNQGMLALADELAELL